MADNVRTILILVYLTFGFQNLRSSAAVNDTRICACSTGKCDFSQVCFPASNCTKENIALGKPAEMSSMYGEPEPSGPACVAVNGNTSSVYQPMFNGELNPNCIHTGVNDLNPWWLVRLGRNYTITDIVVSVRNTQPRRMDRVIITVDAQECYTFPNGTDIYPLLKSISCRSPTTGSFLTLYKYYSGPFDYSLNVCEIQIWVCIPGLYGRDCNQLCNCKNNATCDNYFGTCTAGCREGFYGNNCFQRCVNCGYPGTCNMTSGRCSAGCKNGWQEPLCKACMPGYYGLDCEQKCGYCKGGVKCNISDGKCPDGCDLTYVPPLCKELQSCREGFYGLNCSKKCGDCIFGISCNASSGVCQYGCEDGFLHPLCNETCPSGTWGRLCKSVCGSCNGSTCHHGNGSCEAGCIPGFVGDLCTVCREGYYGLNCSRKCGNCISDMNCNISSGMCPYGCDDGFLPPLCNEKCPLGTWGKLCKGVCGNCNGSACRNDNGTCETGCIPGFVGDLCSVSLDQRNDGLETRALIGAIIGAGFFLGACIFAAVLIWCRFHKSQLAQNNTGRRSGEDNPQFDELEMCGNSAMGNIRNRKNVYEKPENEKEENRTYVVLSTKKQNNEDIDYEEPSNPRISFSSYNASLFN